ncbi:MAG: hypothetical protein HY699_02145 [Deltaproteobacteria bacterium]|nr:hypothetical protein [Deltaproteobacteria bacterium]
MTMTPAAGNILVFVNSPAGTALSERGLQVARAAAPAKVLHREQGRLKAIAGFCGAVARERPETVYGIDNALAVVCGALVGRLLWGSQFILDSGDAVGPLRAKLARGNLIGGTLGSLLEKTGYLLATTVVARSSGLAERVRSLSRKPVVVIPDGFDSAQLPAANGDESRRRWGWSAAHLVVGVIGSAVWNERLNWCYGRDVIEAVARTKRDEVRGALIVRGNGVPRLRELAAQLGVADRVVFETPFDGYAVYEQIRGFDVGLSTQTNDAVGQCRTSGKLVQYLAAGVYILASRVGEAARVLPDAMTVPYEGAWDEQYFARLAQRIDGLPARPARPALRQLAAAVNHSLSERFEYAGLRLRWGELLRAPKWPLEAAADSPFSPIGSGGKEPA